MVRSKNYFKEEVKMSLKTKLVNKIEAQLDKLEELEIGSDKYKAEAELLVKLLDKYNDLDKNDLEYEIQKENRKLEEKLKKKELLDKRIDNIVKNLITIGTFSAGAALTIWGTKASFEFEKEGVITTIMGRGFINKLLHKN